MGKMIEICVIVHGQTPAALKVSDGGEPIWVPKSQIEYDDEFEDGDDIVIFVPEWLAIEKGFI